MLAEHCATARADRTTRDPGGSGTRDAPHHSTNLSTAHPRV
ncbi:hypothetical protein [Streptomyces sp. NPDC102487]